MAVTRIPIPQWMKTQQADTRLESSLSELNLAVRTINGLEEAGILTVGDVLNCTPEQLLELPNLAEKTLATIYAALEEIDFVRDLCPSESAEGESSYPLLLVNGG
jgi:DNA-directed RNA polymerase alpha subunit